ncbi:hypothetical protein C8Q72DRAFT_10159 [Fomitopsis betulina]|nr:hypothetical protein C8Q72DRAFT_10159 [Fomitopsis betulina]
MIGVLRVATLQASCLVPCIRTAARNNLLICSSSAFNKQRCRPSMASTDRPGASASASRRLKVEACSEAGLGELASKFRRPDWLESSSRTVIRRRSASKTGGVLHRVLAQTSVSSLSVPTVGRHRVSHARSNLLASPPLSSPQTAQSPGSQVVLSFSLYVSP